MGVAKEAVLRGREQPARLGEKEEMSEGKKGEKLRPVRGISVGNIQKRSDKMCRSREISSHGVSRRPLVGMRESSGTEQEPHTVTRSTARKANV
jgi:hypothetical protein